MVTTNCVFRFLSDAPNCRNDLNIIAGDDFKSANKMLKVKAAQFKASGGFIKHFPAISDADIVRISSHLDRTTNLKIQDEVAFNILYYDCQRGQEDLARLTKLTGICRQRRRLFSMDLTQTVFLISNFF